MSVLRREMSGRGEGTLAALPGPSRRLRTRIFLRIGRVGVFPRRKTPSAVSGPPEWVRVKKNCSERCRRAAECRRYRDRRTEQRYLSVAAGRPSSAARPPSV